MTTESPGGILSSHPVRLRIGDEMVISLMYELQHPHILQIGASDPALVFPRVVAMNVLQPFDQIVKILFTKHPQYHGLEFKGQHYTTVAKYFMGYFLERL